MFPRDSHPNDDANMQKSSEKEMKRGEWKTHLTVLEPLAFLIPDTGDPALAILDCINSSFSILLELVQVQCASPATGRILIHPIL